MTISVPVRSLDTHELMPGDIYPHPAAGEFILCHIARSVLSSVTTSCISAARWLFFCLFSSQVSFFPKNNDVFRGA